MISMVFIEGLCRIFDTDTLPIVIYAGHSVLWPAEFDRCVPSDMQTKGTSVSLSLSIALTSISTLRSSSIPACLFLPPPVHSVNFTVEAFHVRIAVEAMLTGVKEMFGVGWPRHQPSPAFYDVSTPGFDRTLMVLFLWHILESV